MVTRAPLIPFLDVAAATSELQAEIDDAVNRVLRSGRYILGPEVEAFESEYAEFVGANHCVGVGNGLDALRLSLMALDVGPGDEVIVPANTYIATWLAVSQVGATLVPVDPDEGSFNLTADGVAAALTPNTKAIIPVHLYGRPVDLDPIRELCTGSGVRIVEDAAQAHGARYKGQRIGTGADVVAWSFYPGKNLGAVGDAGAVTTDDRDLADRIRRIGNYGSEEKYINTEVGLNSRLDPIQAAVLRVKLPHLDEWNRRRSRIAARYADGLANELLRLPDSGGAPGQVWHLYVVRCDNREALARHLANAGVATLIHYPIPPHQQAAYADLNFELGRFPRTERIHSQVLSLPIGPHLSDEQQQVAIDAVLAWEGGD